MTKQNFLCITDHHIFIDHIFCLTIHISFSLKNILKNHPASWHWMMNFYRCRLWIPQNILQILQCILWSTQDRTYNCTVHLMEHTRQDIQFCWWSKNHRLLFVLLTHTYHTGTCILYGTEFHSPSCLVYDTTVQLDHLRHCQWRSSHHQHGNL